METKDILRKIQNIVIDDNMKLDSTENMYCRHNADISILENGEYRFLKNSSYDFSTCFNILSVVAWKRYTNAKRFFIVLDIKGTFQVEVFGYFKIGNGCQKEHEGRYIFENKERGIIKIPCEYIQSWDIGFELETKSDVVLYDAYYAAEIEDSNKENKVNIAILTNSSDNTGFKSINKKIYNRLISEGAFEASKIEWIEYCSDAERKKCIQSENYSHFIELSKNTLLFPDSLVRLYNMLLLMKDDYKSCDICVQAIDANKPNIQKEIALVEGAYTDNDLGELDMNSIESIIEAHARIHDALNGAVDNSYAYVCKERSCLQSEENKIIVNGLLSWKRTDEKKSINPVTKKGLANVRIQNILLKESMNVDITKHMYFRSEKDVVIDEVGNIHLPAGAYYEFFTYYNALSIGKWRKFTNIEDVSLVLDIKGDFKIDLFGHYRVGQNIQKEIFNKSARSYKQRQAVAFSYPSGAQSIVVSFGIYAVTDLVVYDAYYNATVKEENIKKPLIAMATTTFKKESFILRNIDLLTKNLFSDSRFKDGFFWNIVDNGQTLDTSLSNEYIQIIPNPNIGGAGGFARGMMTSLRQEKNYTHILLMDDDVVFIPESFKRLYMLLALLKDECQDYFVSGAMLNMDAPNIQHENTGKLVEEGYCIPLHSGRDLNLWDQVLLNEIDPEDLSYRYAAWWFCCIPTTVANEDNLPLPVFVRGDDMEYSLRNHAKFITLNGISIFHQGFVGKFNAPMDFYQSKRNELIVFTTVPELSKIDSFGCIEELFWQQLYKFDYVGAEYLADAVEDFLKGPEWFSSVDLFAELQKRRKKDNAPKPITDAIRSLIDYDTLYDHKPMGKFKKMVYDYTYNGQQRLSIGNSKKKIGIIPYNFSYYPSRMQLTSVNYAIDVLNDKYVELRKDRNKFKELKGRWEEIKQKYLSTKDSLAKHYQEYEKEITNIEFWDSYVDSMTK